MDFSFVLGYVVLFLPVPLPPQGIMVDPSVLLGLVYLLVQVLGFGKTRVRSVRAHLRQVSNRMVVSIVAPGDVGFVRVD